MAMKWNVGAGALAAAAVLAMAGCSSTKLDTPAPVETRTPTDASCRATCRRSSTSSMTTQPSRSRISLISACPVPGLTLVSVVIVSSCLKVEGSL